MHERVLLVEDNPTQRILCIEELSDLGYDVVEACDGREALEALGEGSFDLIISDIERPVMNGLELVAKIRKSTDEIVSTLPVIMLTGRDDDEAIRAAYECGATSFVPKPVNWLSFGHHVRFVIRSAASEAALREARDIANRTLEAREKMMMTLRHELRSPLHVIKGFAEVLDASDAVLPEETATAVTFMCDAAININDHLTKIFTYHDVINRQSRIERTRVPLSDLTLEVIQALADKTAAKQIMLSHEMNDGATIHADRTILKFAIHQVIENAIKFSSEGGRIEIRGYSGPGASCCLSVTDHGSGFDVSDPESLLEPFAQGDDGLTRRSTGVGIGLSTADLIVRQHDGSLSLENAPGEGGAQVTITLPELLATHHEQQAEKQPLSA